MGVLAKTVKAIAAFTGAPTDEELRQQQLQQQQFQCACAEELAQAYVFERLTFHKNETHRLGLVSIDQCVPVELIWNASNMITGGVVKISKSLLAEWPDISACQSVWFDMERNFAKWLQREFNRLEEHKRTLCSEVELLNHEANQAKTEAEFLAVQSKIKSKNSDYSKDAERQRILCEYSRCRITEVGDSLDGQWWTVKIKYN